MKEALILFMFLLIYKKFGMKTFFPLIIFISIAIPELLELNFGQKGAGTLYFLEIFNFFFFILLLDFSIRV
jgi:hypothetical protein